MQRTIKTGNGTSCTFDTDTNKVYESIEEWKAEGKRRFGEDFMKWKFVCPMCGHVAAVEDFRQYKDQGAEPDSSYVECIGRYTGAPGPEKVKDASGCNWAAYGLFGIPKGGVFVITGEDKGTHIFDFAEAANE